MTMNILVREFQTVPFMRLHDETLLVRLDWVTSGHYWLRIEPIKGGIDFEPGQLPELLEAYQSAPKPSKRNPFWTCHYTGRGWIGGEHLLEAYATIKEGYVKIIASACNDMFQTGVPYYLHQMLISVETLAEVSEVIESRTR